MTKFTADQLRSIINLSERRYNECRISAGRDADITKRMLELNKTAAAMLQEMAPVAKYEHVRN